MGYSERDWGLAGDCPDFRPPSAARRRKWDCPFGRTAEYSRFRPIPHSPHSQSVVLKKGTVPFSSDHASHGARNRDSPQAVPPSSFRHAPTTPPVRRRARALAAGRRGRAIGGLGGLAERAGPVVRLCRARSAARANRAGPPRAGAAGSWEPTGRGLLRAAGNPPDRAAAAEADRSGRRFPDAAVAGDAATDRVDRRPLFVRLGAGVGDRAAGGGSPSGGHAIDHSAPAGRRRPGANRRRKTPGEAVGRDEGACGRRRSR